jgi:hypothetical protein
LHLSRCLCCGFGWKFEPVLWTGANHVNVPIEYPHSPRYESGCICHLDHAHR